MSWKFIRNSLLTLAILLPDHRPVYTEPYARLASRLVPASGMAAAFFGNSGAEANEGMIKTARKYSYEKYVAFAQASLA